MTTKDMIKASIAILYRGHVIAEAREKYSPKTSCMSGIFISSA